MCIKDTLSAQYFRFTHTVTWWNAIFREIAFCQHYEQVYALNKLIRVYCVHCTVYANGGKNYCYGHLNRLSFLLFSRYILKWVNGFCALSIFFSLIDCVFYFILCHLLSSLLRSRGDMLWFFSALLFVCLFRFSSSSRYVL